MILADMTAHGKGQKLRSFELPKDLTFMTEVCVHVGGWVGGWVVRVSVSMSMSVSVCTAVHGKGQKLRSCELPKDLRHKHQS